MKWFLLMVIVCKDKFHWSIGILRVTCHVTHLKEFAAVRVRTLYNFIWHKFVCTVNSIIREFRDKYQVRWRDIGGEKRTLWVVLGLLISQSKHQSDAGTLLDSVYTVYVTADCSVWSNSPNFLCCPFLKPLQVVFLNMNVSQSSSLWYLGLA